MSSSSAPPAGGEFVPAEVSRGVLPTSTPQAEAWGRRQLPPVEEVRPGVWAIPVPVRVAIRYVYCYLILGTEHAVLIDPGEKSKEAAEALSAAFAQIGFDERQLVGILVTHFHFDHWEGADELAERTGAWVALSRREWEWVQALTADDTSPEGMLEWFLSFGAPPETALELATTADYRDTLVYRAPDHLLEPGEFLPISGERLQVIDTPGHSPGHVCLYDHQRDVLFSGDHILPNITPHIALNRFGAPDPLSDYLESLERVGRLGEPEVLPAHEYRFTGLAARIDELRADIEQRADEVRALVAQHTALTPWDAASQLTWSRQWHVFQPAQRRMATDETAAHFARLGL